MLGSFTIQAQRENLLYNNINSSRYDGDYEIFDTTININKNSDTIFQILGAFYNTSYNCDINDRLMYSVSTCDKLDCTFIHGSFIDNMDLSANYPILGWECPGNVGGTNYIVVSRSNINNIDTVYFNIINKNLIDSKIQIKMAFPQRYLPKCNMIVVSYTLEVNISFKYNGVRDIVSCYQHYDYIDILGRIIDKPNKGMYFERLYCNELGWKINKYYITKTY